MVKVTKPYFEIGPSKNGLTGTLFSNASEQSWWRIAEVSHEAFYWPVSVSQTSGSYRSYKISD